MGKLDGMRSRLGRNVAESIGATERPPLKVADGPTGPQPPRVKRDESGYTIPLALIDRDPEQPREDFDEGSIAGLAESLREQGQLQPCLVVEEDEGPAPHRYTLVCGERRFRAALHERSNLEALTCRVWRRSALADPARLVELRMAQLVENWQRKDLNPIEVAKSLGRLIVMGLTQEDLARKTGRAQGTVSKALALLKLPADVQDRIRAGEMSADAGRELLRIGDDAVIRRVASEAVEAGSTTAAAIRGAAKGRSGPTPNIPLEYSQGKPAPPGGIIPLEYSAPAGAGAGAGEDAGGAGLPWMGEKEHLATTASSDGSFADLTFLAIPGEDIRGFVGRLDALLSRARLQVLAMRRFRPGAYVEILPPSPLAGARATVVHCDGASVACDIPGARPPRQRLNPDGIYLMAAAPSRPEGKPSPKAKGRP